MLFLSILSFLVAMGCAALQLTSPPPAMQVFLFVAAITFGYLAGTAFVEWESNRR